MTSIGSLRLFAMTLSALMLAALPAFGESSSESGAMDKAGAAKILAPNLYVTAESRRVALATFAWVPMPRAPRAPHRQITLRYAIGSEASLRPFVGVVLAVRRQPMTPIDPAANYDARFGLAPGAGFALSF
jgi:hypothetical protein